MSNLITNKHRHVFKWSNVCITRLNIFSYIYFYPDNDYLKNLPLSLLTFFPFTDDLDLNQQNFMTLHFVECTWYKELCQLKQDLFVVGRKGWYMKVNPSVRFWANKTKRVHFTRMEPWCEMQIVFCCNLFC